MTDTRNCPVDVLVITRERRSHLVTAIESIIPELGPADNIHVLENGCPQNSTSGLEESFPGVRWHRTPTNLGVPGGRNFLLRASENPIAVFVDDDAVVASGTLTALRNRFEADDRLSAVAFRIDHPDTGSPRSFEFPFKGLSDVEIERPTTYFVGAGFALRRAAAMDAGMFDDSLFYGLEELDLSYALIDRGWSIRYVPDARVVHHAAPEGRPKARRIYFMTRNRIIVASTRLPRRHLVSQVVFWSTFFLVQSLRSFQLRSFVSGLRDGYRVALERKREGMRKELSGEAIRYLRAHGGRLYY